jgi:hypothetical protein
MAMGYVHIEVLYLNGSKREREREREREHSM